MGISFAKTAVAGAFPVFWRGEFKVLPGDFKIKQTFPEGTLIKKGTPIQLDFDNMECGVVKVAKVIAGGTTTIPRVTKGTLLKAGDVVAKVGNLGLTRTVSSVDTSNDNYDVVTLNGAITDLADGDFLQEAAAAVKGVYTLTISTAPTAADILHVDGVNYVYAAAESDTEYAVGSNAKDAAANIEDALSAQYAGIFSVVAKNGKLIFTQLTAGVGDIPVVSVTQTGGTLVAAVEETTEGVASVLYSPDAVTVENVEYKADSFTTLAAGYEGLVLKEVAYPIPSTWLTGFSLTKNPGIKYIKQ